MSSRATVTDQNLVNQEEEAKKQGEEIKARKEKEERGVLQLEGGKEFDPKLFMKAVAAESEIIKTDSPDLIPITLMSPNAP